MATINESPLQPTAALANVQFTPLEALPAVMDGGASGLSEADKKEIERLRSEHPDYTSRKNHWTFLLLAYEGGPGYVSDETLFKHQRETQDSYDTRKKRAVYWNYTRPVVDFVAEWIYQMPPDRKPDAGLRDAFNVFAEDCDRCGTHLNDFWEQVAENTRLFGLMYVGVDKPALPPNSNRDQISVAKARELRLDIPYLIQACPLEVLYWNVDRYGRYDYIKRRELVTERNGFMFKTIERYTEWTPEEFSVSLIDVTDDQHPVLTRGTSKPNPWNFVPFRAVFHTRSKINRDVGISAVEDIAYQNRAIFNYTSYIDEFLGKQCFNLLAKPSDIGIPTKDQSPQDVIGESTLLEYPAGSNPPSYVSPPTDPAQFIQNERSTLIQEIYRGAAMDTMGELFGSDQRSGDAARQQFSRTAPVLAKFADHLQMAEMDVLQMWAKMMRKAWKGTVSYRDDYGAATLLDILIQLTTIFNTLHILPPAFVKNQWLRIIRMFDGRIDPETMASIIKQVEAMTDEELKDLYSTAKDTKATDGLPSTADMMQGQEQIVAGNDKNIGGMKGTQAGTKETLPDSQKRMSKSRRRVRGTLKPE